MITDKSPVSTAETRVHANLLTHNKKTHILLRYYKPTKPQNRHNLGLVLSVA